MSKKRDNEQVSRLIAENYQYKAERDTLIDDLSWYKAKVSGLEQIRDIKDNVLKGANIKIETLEKENKKINEEYEELNRVWKESFKFLQEENKDLRLQSDTYFEQWQQHKALNNEFSQHIGNKPSSSTYKYFRAKLDGVGIKEGE